jgi:hypothetical protein
MPFRRPLSASPEQMRSLVSARRPFVLVADPFRARRIYRGQSTESRDDSLLKPRLVSQAVVSSSLFFACSL